MEVGCSSRSYGKSTRRSGRVRRQESCLDAGGKWVSLGLCGAEWGIVVNHAADRHLQPLDRREAAGGDPQTPARRAGRTARRSAVHRPGNRRIAGPVHGGSLRPPGRPPGPSLAHAAGRAAFQPAVLRPGPAGGVRPPGPRADPARVGRIGRPWRKRWCWLGVQDHLELWAADRWQSYLAEKQAHYDEIAETAFGPATALRGETERIESVRVAAYENRDAEVFGHRSASPSRRCEGESRSHGHGGRSPRPRPAGDVRCLRQRTDRKHSTSCGTRKYRGGCFLTDRVATRVCSNLIAERIVAMNLRVPRPWHTVACNSTFQRP